MCENKVVKTVKENKKKIITVAALTVGGIATYLLVKRIGGSMSFDPADAFTVTQDTEAVINGVTETAEKIAEDSGKWVNEFTYVESGFPWGYDMIRNGSSVKELGAIGEEILNCIPDATEDTKVHLMMSVATAVTEE